MMCEDPEIREPHDMPDEAAADDERAAEPVTGGAKPTPPSQETRSTDGTDQSIDASAELASDDSEPADAHASEATVASDVCSPAEAVHVVETQPADAFELEELTLPSSILGLEPLAAGTRVGPDAMLQVEELRQQRGRINIYRALPVVGPEPRMEIELLEGPFDHAGLQRTADILSEVHYPMLPSLQAAWEDTGRRYIALEARSGPTLDEALAGGMPADEVISTVLQLAQALRRLHQAGWVLLGLTPAGIQMSQPVRITQLTTALRVGESLPDALHVAGYSAPELVNRTQVTGKEDVYSLGAILYRGLSGVQIAEEGSDLSSLSDVVQTPGAPQLLASVLAPVSERIDLEGFYRGLLALKRRLASTPIALRVASGTTIGLNPTRPTNEDACGYLSWTTAHEGYAAYHAVLCAIDGMGGMEAGEVASTSALRAVLRTAATYASEQMAGHGDTSDASTNAVLTGETDQRPSPSLNPVMLVQNAAEAAHAAAAGRQVGATITCAVVENGRLTLGHVGDTRGYLLRDGRLVRLTRDHSLVAAMVASGILTDDEARGHPESNKVLRSLGGLRRLPADYIDGLTVAYGQDMLTLQSGDQLLLCSDGVWGVISDDELQQILADADDPEQAVATIIDAVLAGGAPDNAAAIVARCNVMPAA